MNVAFIGPSSKSISAMGDKIMSKRIAKEANVHIIPGFDGVITDEAHCLKIANQIGTLRFWSSSSGHLLVKSKLTILFKRISGHDQGFSWWWWQRYAYCLER